MTLLWSSPPPAAGTDALPWNPADLQEGCGTPGTGVPPAATEAERAVLREEELEEVRRDAFTAGEQAGRERVLQEKGRVLEQALQALQEATGACHASMARWEATLEQNLAALAMATARHVVEREVRAEPGVVTALVRRALAAFPPDQRIRVRLNPEDMSALSAAGPGGRSLAPQGREVEWIADPEIGTGGCMVEGPESVLDGRVDTALERIYWSLVE